MAGKEASVFIIDVNPSMGVSLGGDSDESGLDVSKRAIRLLLQQKLLFPKSDEFAVLTVGSDGTDNELNRQADGEYEHVSVLKTLMRAELDHLSLLDNIDTEHSYGDVVNALLVAMQLLHDRVQHYKFTKRIWLFTDGAGDILDDPEGFEQICEGFRASDYKINVVGVNFDDDDQDDESGNDEDGEAVDGSQKRTVSKHEDPIVDPRPLCQFGAKCYRKNPAHFAEFRHPHLQDSRSQSDSAASEQRDADSSASDDNNGVDRCPAARGKSGTRPPRTATQIKNEKMLRELCDRVGGLVMPTASAISILSNIRRTVNQVTKYRGPLTIGDVSIEVYTYGKTSVQSMPTLKKEIRKTAHESLDGEEGDNAGMADTGHIAQQRTYYDTKAESGRSEVSDSMRVKGFHYGHELIAFTDEQIADLKPQNDKCLTVLAFIPASELHRCQFMGSVDAVVSCPGDNESGAALSAFIQGLIETDKVALCRYVKRQNDRPLLGVLIPHVGTIECLWFNQLPFAEDIRDFSFASIDSNPAFIPNEDQLAAAAALIQSMDLMNAATDDTGETMEAFQPALTFNPVLQRFYDNVQRRALDPSADLAELDPAIAKYCTPDPALLERAEGAFANFGRVFPLQVTEKSAKKKKRQWNFYESANAGEGGGILLDTDIETIKMTGAVGDTENKAGTIDSAFARHVTQVGSVTPVEDFRSMLARRDDSAVIERAIAQMKAVIADLVKSSFGDALYDKALDCTVALRQASVQFNEAEQFNAFLVQQIKQQLRRLKPSLWRAMEARRILPISTAEVEDSDISACDADRFYAEDTAVPSAVESLPESNNTEDDLFAEMD